MRVVAPTQRSRAPAHGDREQALADALRYAFYETSTLELAHILFSVLSQVRLVNEILSVADRKERAHRVALCQLKIAGLEGLVVEELLSLGEFMLLS